MNKRIAMAFALTLSIVSLAACGKDNTTAAPAATGAEPAQTSEVKADVQATDSQTEAATEADRIMPLGNAGLNVAVIDEKRANITVRSNGGEYFGYSLQMFDPALGGVSSGNYYDVTLTDTDGSGYTCSLTGYRDWNADYIASEEVKFDDLGNGDYLFRITLPDSDVISFYSIDTYRVNVRTSASDATFYSAGDFAYSDVCQFMDEEAAAAARNSGGGASAGASSGGKLSQDESERMSEVFKSFRKEYRNGNYDGLQITGDYGTFQLWPVIVGGFSDRFEIHLYSEKDDLGDDIYSIHATIDGSNTVTIEVVGREGHGADGKSITLVLAGSSVTMTSDGKTVTLTDDDMIRDLSE